MKSINALRHSLLARGLTMKPTCPGCSRQVPPSKWGPAGKCAQCERTGRTALAWERERDARRDVA